MTGDQRALAVAVHDVFVLYRGRGSGARDVAALRGLSLRVAAGERLVVHGPNGSGKTTLLRVLTGEQPASAGRVEVAGTEVTSDSRPAALLRSRSLGVVDQHPARVLRPEWSVLDNVALQCRLRGLGGAESRARAAETLTRFGLESYRDRVVGTLSGGEAQRVGVCAALAHGPDLLLADEPTGELDRVAAERAYDVLAEAADAAGAALLLVTHDPAAARIADRVVRIRDGRLSEQWEPGSAQEVLVVDERGWVRLPEAVRRATGAQDGVHLVRRGGSVELRGTGPAEAVSAADRAVEPAVGAAAVAGPVAAEQPVATLHEVTVDRGGRRVLDRVCAAVPPGRLTVVHGRSGSGKSTLLRMLAGLDRPDAGTVTVAGTDLADLDRAGLAGLRRTTVGYAGQTAALAEALDVAENVRAGRTVRGLADDEAAVERWLDALDLTALRHREVAALSGGERARVAVARALVAAPALVLLDEPSAQLDEANAERLALALRAAAGHGPALVVASHDPVLVAAADHAVPLG